MAYTFYLDRMVLPITPSKLQIKINNKNSTMTLINDGEINILKSAGLSEIEFEASLPNVKYPFSKGKNAQTYLNKLELLKSEAKPFQFIVTRKRPSGGSLFNTNIKVSLESYDIKEDAKEGIDVTVNIRLKQYRDYGLKTCVIAVEGDKVDASVEEVRETDNSPAPATATTYTVVKGDTLSKIAKSFYGNSSKYPVIASANNISNPNVISVGQVLTIPAV